MKAFFNRFRIKHFEVLESTNTAAMALLKTDNASHGEVIQADFQSNGKGQVGNTWFSDPGKNLLFTVICKDVKWPVEKLSHLNISVSLALFDLVNAYFPHHCTLKWPNDVYIDDKKVAGLLIETVLSGNNIKHFIIGVGLNVNQEQFPKSLKNAASFYSLKPQKYDLETILNVFLEFLNHRMSRTNSVSPEELFESYHSVLYQIKVKRYFRSLGEIFEGTIIGVNKEGMLRVETQNGIKIFKHKEISFDLSDN